MCTINSTFVDRSAENIILYFANEYNKEQALFEALLDMVRTSSNDNDSNNF